MQQLAVLRPVQLKAPGRSIQSFTLPTKQQLRSYHLSTPALGIFSSIKDKVKGFVDATSPSQNQNPEPETTEARDWKNNPYTITDLKGHFAKLNWATWLPGQTIPEDKKKELERQFQISKAIRDEFGGMTVKEAAKSPQFIAALAKDAGISENDVKQFMMKGIGMATMMEDAGTGKINIPKNQAELEALAKKHGVKTPTTFQEMGDLAAKAGVLKPAEEAVKASMAEAGAGAAPGPRAPSSHRPPRSRRPPPEFPQNYEAKIPPKIVLKQAMSKTPKKGYSAQQPKDSQAATPGPAEPPTKSPDPADPATA